MISNIQNQTSQINFNGGFLIDYRYAVKGTMEYMETKAINNHRNIFRNWEGDSKKVFYITKDSKDFQVANAIFLNGLKAKYFPKINTKLRVDENCPEVLEKYLTMPEYKESISGAKRIYNYVEKTRPHSRTVVNSHLKKVRTGVINIEDKIFNELNMVYKANKKTFSNGVTTFVSQDNPFNKVVIAPQAKNGSYYVYTYYSKFMNDNRYYIFDEFGNLIKKYESNELGKFFTNFEESVRRYKQMHPTRV